MCDLVSGPPSAKPIMKSECGQEVDQFVRVLTGHQPQLYAFIRLLVPQRADAEEVLQETNATLWRKVDEFPDVKNFRAWSCAIARLEVLRYRQTRQRDRLVFNGEFIDTVIERVNQQGELLDERRQALDNCIDKLRQRDRDLIQRRYVEGATTQSVAEAVGRSIDAVYKSLARIRRTLFECVERRLSAQERV